MPKVMNANDVLIDLLEDNRRRLHRVIGEMSDDLLHWTPDPGANSIAVTRYQCIQMALLDNVRHLGEIFSLRAMWDRRNGVI